MAVARGSNDLLCEFEKRHENTEKQQQQQQQRLN
jgi:hypothetical protein